MFLFSPGSAKTDIKWDGKLKKYLMASCLRNIRTKNYWNLITLLKVTIKNVPDVFETQCIKFRKLRTTLCVNFTAFDSLFLFVLLVNKTHKLSPLYSVFLQHHRAQLRSFFHYSPRKLLSSMYGLCFALGSTLVYSAESCRHFGASHKWDFQLRRSHVIDQYRYFRAALLASLASGIKRLDKVRKYYAVYSVGLQEWGLTHSIWA